jgi:hypothetical protein
LLISFNRFHNYVVGELAAINEGGRFSHPVRDNVEKKVRGMSLLKRPPPSEDAIQKDIKEQYEAAGKKRDNDLFQTGRL